MMKESFWLIIKPLIAWQNKLTKHGDHLSVQRIKIMDSSELTAAKRLINFFI